MLTVFDTHPVQYRAPIYRTLQRDFGIPVTTIYESDLSVSGYHDREFGTAFAWDTDLLSGYTPVFLSGRSMREALKSLSPSATLLVGYGDAYHRTALRTSLQLEKPILFRAETTDHARKRSAAKAMVRDMFLRRIYTRCEALLYIGTHSYQHFRRLKCPERKLFFSPYCVDTAPFLLDDSDRSRLRRRVRKELEISTETRVVLFSGKLVERKGPDRLLSALKSSKDRMKSPIVVVFLGDGQMQQQLRHYAQEPPEIQTRFVGFRNQTELSPYYHAADVVALPSRYSETWGLVVNEALHHGVPAVVTDAVGCAPDLVVPNVTGEIAKTDSVDSLAASLESALILSEDPRTRKRCRAQIQEYTVQKAAEGIHQAYRSVTTEPRPMAHTK